MTREASGHAALCTLVPPTTLGGDSIGGTF